MHQSDVAIVGGGILGVVTARLLAEMGLQVVVFRLSDAVAPNADTLRNQAWLQSGLRYVRNDRVLAEKMWTHGRRLHEFFGLTPPSGRGVVQVGSPHEADGLEDDARQLGISAEVAVLSSEQAAALLGPLHRPDGIAFETPETPFREAALLAEAREVASAAGVRFRETRAPVQLVPLPNEMPSHCLVADGVRLTVGTTVLTAGAGNIPLLSALRSSLQLELRQTPLLVIPGPPVITSPILLDKPAGLSVVAHQPGHAGRPDGCMVIGTNVRDEQVSYCEASARRIGPETRRRVYENLPDCLRLRFDASRFTAGWEVILHRDGREVPTAQPWVEAVDGHPDVLVCSSGRATLALYTAETIAAKVNRSRPQPLRGEPANSPAGLPGTDWNRESQIWMHFDSHYNGLNDA